MSALAARWCASGMGRPPRNPHAKRSPCTTSQTPRTGCSKTGAMRPSTWPRRWWSGDSPYPEEAARLGIQAIAVPQEQRTETVRKRAVELYQLLDTWHTTPAVKDFAERLRAYQLPASAA
jgi:hypothetical protein